MTSQQVVTPQEMTEQEKAYLARTYPGLNLSGKPKKRYAKSQVVKPAKSKQVLKNSKFYQAISRPWYHVILWLLVGLFAYIYIGIGWLLGHIAEAFYDGGKWLHEFKWKLGKK